jgi:hypothetical protein
MNTVTKTLVGTVATLAMAAGSVAPAAAQDRYRDRDHISTGEVVAGAIVLGGIAAVAAAASNDRNRDYRDGDYRYGDRDYRDRDYRDDDYRGGYRDRNWDGRGSGWYNWDSNRRYGRGGNNPERAVSQCIRAAENQAERYGGGRADVTRIRDIDRERGGFEVTGTIQVSQRGWGNNRGGWNNSRGRNIDTARFYCDYRRGQVVDIDFDGLNNRYR